MGDNGVYAATSRYIPNVTVKTRPMTLAPIASTWFAFACNRLATHPLRAFLKASPVVFQRDCDEQDDEVDYYETDYYGHNGYE